MPRLDHFDFLAPLYDLIFSPPHGGKLAELAELPINGLLLDVGGGTGRVAQGFVHHAEQVVVADSSHRMLAQTHRKQGLLPAECLAEQLPFAAGCFQRVIMVDSYHHLADQLQSLREGWRVLGPGGLLVVEEPNIENLGVKLMAVGERLLRMRSHPVPGDQVAELLAAMDAEVEVHKGSHTYWVVARKH